MNSKNEPFNDHEQPMSAAIMKLVGTAPAGDVTDEQIDALFIDAEKL